MAVGTWRTYDDVPERLDQGVIDLQSHDFFVALFTSDSNADDDSHGVLADLTNEVAEGTGYSSGGPQVTGASATTSGGVYTFTFDPVVYTADGGSITARYAVIYRSGTIEGVEDALVARLILDTSSGTASVTVTDGNTLTINPPSEGVLRIRRPQ